MPEGATSLSLERAEDGRFVKADIFERPVSFSVESHANVSSPEEALSASLNKFGTVNLDYMREITDSTEEGLLDALKGHASSTTRSTGYEIKDRFIAGNVIEKAERIEAWMGGNPENGRMPEVKQALEALKEAEPPRIAFEDLDFNFGERWIPTGVYAAYMSCLFDTDVKIAYSASMDEFSVACGYRTMKITDEFLVKGYYRNYDGMHLLKHALHNTCPDMMKSIGKDEHGNDIKVRDSEAYSSPTPRLTKSATGSRNGWKSSRRSSRNGSRRCITASSTVSYAEVRRLAPDLSRPQSERIGKPGYSKCLPVAEGLRLDDKTERRRYLRP